MEMTNHTARGKRLPRKALAILFEGGAVAIHSRQRKTRIDFFGLRAPLWLMEAMNVIVGLCATRLKAMNRSTR